MNHQKILEALKKIPEISKVFKRKKIQKSGQSGFYDTSSR